MFPNKTNKCYHVTEVEYDTDQQIRIKTLNCEVHLIVRRVIARLRQMVSGGT